MLESLFNSRNWVTGLRDLQVATQLLGRVKERTWAAVGIGFWNLA